MIGSLFDRLIGCPHRRMTRPITPVSKPGVPSGETYVVCLDCGKQFAYDWDHMRVGKAILPSGDSGVLNQDMPKPKKTKLRYALLGSAIPLGVVVGAALFAKRRTAAPRGDEAPTAGKGAKGIKGLDQYIELPFGGSGARFQVRQLVDHIRETGRDYIIQGQVNCSVANHPKPGSLDYWLRERFARNKDVKQAADEVIGQLVATGFFEEVPDLLCPDSGDECSGIRLVGPA